jgi:multidrug efflux pump subunit AcrB
MFKDTSIKFVEPPAGPPTMGAIVAEIYGENPNGIRNLADRVKTVFESTDGLVDVDIMQDEIFDKIEISVNVVKIARSGLNIKQVNDILYLALEGMNIAVRNSNIYDQQIPIFLTLQPKDKIFRGKDKKSIELKLLSLQLMNSRGMMVPITEVVTINIVKSTPMIVTKNLHQMTNVIAETDMISQVYPLIKIRKEIIEKFSDKYEIDEIGLFNLELQDKETKEIYKLMWDGEMEVTLDTFVELGGAFISALILIFLLMVLYYKSFKLSGIVLLGSMLSIIGVILGHWIMDIFTTDTFFLTATSLIGFIALIGISSRNSLLLIDFTKSLIAGNGMKKREAIAYATATRAKPIFLTAVAIILASTLLASDAVFGGLGVSLIFGTISAVIASLVVIPILMNW